MKKPLLKKQILTGAMMCAMMGWGSANAIPNTLPIYMEVETTAGANDASGASGALDPNGTAEDAGTVAVGVNTISGEILTMENGDGAAVAYDVDFYKFTVAKGRLDLTISTEDNGGLQDSYLALYDSTGTLQYDNDDQPTGDLNSRIGWIDIAAGDYFAAVSSSFNGPDPVAQGLTGAVLSPPDSGTEYTGTSSAPTGDDRSASDVDNIDTEVFAPGTYLLTMTFEELQAALASLTGVKFNDLNGNKVQDEGEDLLAGWTIILSEGSSEIARMTTDTDGVYAFKELDAGKTYTLAEEGTTGWFNTGGLGDITLVDGVNTNDIGNKEGTVPEPATLALLGLGLAGMGFRRRNRKADA